MTTKAQLREASLLAGYPQGHPLQPLRRFVEVLDMVRERDTRIAETKRAKASKADEEARVPSKWGPDVTGRHHYHVDLEEPSGPLDPWKFERAYLSKWTAAETADEEHARILAEENALTWEEAKELLGIRCTCSPDSPEHVHGSGSYDPEADQQPEDDYLETEEHHDDNTRDAAARKFVMTRLSPAGEVEGPSAPSVTVTNTGEAPFSIGKREIRSGESFTLKTSRRLDIL